MTTLKAVAYAEPVADRGYGLLQSADVLEGAAANRGVVEGRWEAGYNVVHEGCGGGGVLDPCNPGTVTPTTSPDFVSVQPFGLYESDICSTIGWESRNYEARARRLLIACQGKKVENEFWTGTLAKAGGALTNQDSPWYGQQFLAREDTSDVVATGATPVVALACLEEYLAGCSCARGMIHATIAVVTHWAELGLLERDGKLLVAKSSGTVIVPGAGYPGTSPTGAPPGAGGVWAYATGWVTVRLGDVLVVPNSMEQAVDREDNTVAYYAERLAAYDFGPCCHGAAEVDIEVCAIGGS